MVDEALVITEDITILTTEANALREEAVALLETVESSASESEKVPGWTKEDQANAKDQAVELATIRQEQMLQSALTHAHDLSSAHEALAALYRKQHESAEHLGNSLVATRSMTRLKNHTSALSSVEPARAEHLAYIKGDGVLTLVTDPPGAEIALERYVTHNRRLVTQKVADLGKTPLIKVPVPMGSYRLCIRHPDRQEVHYPVHITRQAHWDGIAPGKKATTPIWLPPVGTTTSKECYVPAGWFTSGGDPIALRSLPPAPIWVDGFIVKQQPISHRDYIAFLDDLVATGQEALALKYQPRERNPNANGEGSPIYRRTGNTFELAPSEEEWHVDWPVMMVDWWSAVAYGNWYSQKTSLPWRLLYEAEWEKAARGVDMRFFPWGNQFDPTRCRMYETNPQCISPAIVNTHPIDESPYGVRDMAGNVRDWCLDLFELQSIAKPESQELMHDDTTVLRVCRGGTWSNDEPGARLCYRDWNRPAFRAPFVGFRLARPLPSQNE